MAAVKRIRLLTLAAISMALVCATARADAVADFYKGKTITVIVGYGPGGGYDSMARFYARFMGQHIPGAPQVIVQNMPGAPRATNYLYNTAPKDGTTLAVFAASTALDPLFGSSQAKFETDKIEWIGSMDRDVNACAVWKGAGQNIATLSDLVAAKRTVIFGASAAATASTQHTVFLKKMIKANIQIVTGYEGSNAVQLAMQRGEIEGSCGLQVSSVLTSYASDVASGAMGFVVQFGNKPAPAFRNATMIYSMLRTEEEQQIGALIFGPTEVSRPLAAPPGVPADRIAALRTAMLETAKDPEFRAVTKNLGLDVTPIAGEDVAQIFARFMKTPPDMVKKATDYIQLN